MQRESRGTIHVIHEDPDLIVIEKESGLLTYPSEPKVKQSAIQQIRRYWRKRESGNQYLYLLHRLDQETSGLLVFAKTSLARKSLQMQLATHSVVRWYSAITRGIPSKKEGKIETYLRRNEKGRRSVAEKGKYAATFFRVIRENRRKERALVSCRLHTGRTHQVRIHLAHLGAPVIGDRVYGGGPFSRLALHARMLGFIHPRSELPLVFVSSLPQELQSLLR